MSHNKIKVASKTPSEIGEIVLNIDDISSVSTPTDKQTLAYNGTDWIAKSMSVVIDFDETLHTESYAVGGTNSSTILVNYPYSPARFYRFANHTTNLNLYTDSVHNADIEMLEDDFGGGTVWYKGFKFLTAGIYRITAKLVIGPNSTDNSFVELQLSNADNSVTYGPRFQVGNENVKQKNIVGIVNASVNDEVGFYKHGITNSPKYCQVGDPNILIVIERLS